MALRHANLRHVWCAPCTFVGMHGRMRHCPHGSAHAATCTTCDSSEHEHCYLGSGQLDVASCCQLCITSSIVADFQVGELWQQLATSGYSKRRAETLDFCCQLLLHSPVLLLCLLALLPASTTTVCTEPALLCWNTIHPATDRRQSSMQVCSRAAYAHCTLLLELFNKAGHMC